MLAAMLMCVSWRYMVPRSVSLSAVESGLFQTYLSGPATLNALTKADLGSKVSGRLTSVRVDLNDHVVAGQVLATVEQADLQAQALASTSAVHAASSGEMQARAALASAEAGLIHDQGNFNRQAALFKQGWVSQANYDQALASLRSAEAEVAARRQAVQQAVAQVETASAQSQASQAVLGMAEIRAPFDGIITSRNLNPGDLLTPSDKVFEIVSPQTLVLNVRFDETAISAVKPGDKAQIYFGFSPGTSFSGKVLRISRDVDPETREFTADIVPANLPDNWAMNQRATVSIVTGQMANAMSVPLGCIVRRKGTAGVWAVRARRAYWQPVTLGPSSLDRIMIRGGLSASHVICGTRDVYDFMPVETGRKS
ncbi:efflux RND transporter periplasmic adaptor subunit [Asticcacaulis sp. AND118]|uniref:efflux RND transporter periplasmic adaptor subunit n=1 Tax=Asticcacaulis sp. AND118 TaxID=2840468 RepID=UPI001CFFA529|nr:efflux RND transporter periplasmic adaptor subunit [Asticcacaulis sp. AND118]UDF04990.1 efflux RND transporter periplasmic adaptor subunit [Asticcacaulis sp. AND118]